MCDTLSVHISGYRSGKGVNVDTLGPLISITLPPGKSPAVGEATSLTARGGEGANLQINVKPQAAPF